MSKLKGPDHHGESGKIAGKVFYRQFGQQLARSVPTPTTIPPTVKQLDQRYGRFAPAFAFSKQMKYAAKIIYQIPPSSRTAFAEMTKQLFPGFTGTAEMPLVNLTPCVLGNGDLPLINLLTCTNTVPSTVVVTWSSAISTPDETSDDLACFIVSDSECHTSRLIVTDDKRSSGTSTFARPAVLMDVESHVSSVFFTNAVTGKKSTFQMWDAEGTLAG